MAVLAARCSLSDASAAGGKSTKHIAIYDTKPKNWEKSRKLNQRVVPVDGYEVDGDTAERSWDYGKQRYV